MHLLVRTAALIFVLFAVSCIEATDPMPEVNSTSGALSGITWTSVVNASASGNDLVKTASQLSWNAGAVSVETIESRGFVEFTTAETSTEKAAGLSNGDSNQDLADIDFAIYLHGDGSVTVREAGTHKGSFGTYAAGDLFRLDVKHTAAGAVVTYSKNGSVFYTSSTAPTFPLLFDTSLRTQGATINDVIMTDTVRVSTQNNPLTSGRLSCGDNDVITISGSYLRAGSNQTLQQFLGYQQSDIEDRLESLYLTDFPEMTDYAGTLILDMEQPVHPKDLYTYSSSDQDAIVQAWIVRIAAAKAVFPNAKLGMYGTLNPERYGDDQNQDYIDQHAALVEAGTEGLYDDLDYLVPVLYVRFGCDDDGSPLACDNHWDTIDDYTQLGVDGSADLADLPLLPLLTVYVANGNSNFNNTLLVDLDIPDALYATLGMQLDILADNDVDEAALWIGGGDNYDDNAILEVANAANPNLRTIDDYACAF